MARFRQSLPRTLQIAKFPNWTTLPHTPVTDIQADHRINAEIVDGVGRVQVKPGYNVGSIDEIRYTYGN